MSAGKCLHAGVGGPVKRRQRVEAQLWPGVAAHEDVDCCIIVLGPRVDRDVAFRQDRDAGIACTIAEIMGVHAEHGRTRGLGCTAERLAALFRVEQTPGAEELCYDMCSQGRERNRKCYVICQ